MIDAVREALDARDYRRALQEVRSLRPICADADRAKLDFAEGAAAILCKDLDAAEIALDRLPAHFAANLVERARTVISILRGRSRETLAQLSERVESGDQPARATLQWVQLHCAVEAARGGDLRAARLFVRRAGATPFADHELRRTAVELAAGIAGRAGDWAELSRLLDAHREYAGEDEMRRHRLAAAAGDLRVGTFVELFPEVIADDILPRVTLRLVLSLAEADRFSEILGLRPIFQRKGWTESVAVADLLIAFTEYFLGDRNAALETLARLATGSPVATEATTLRSRIDTEGLLAQAPGVARIEADQKSRSLRLWTLILQTRDYDRLAKALTEEVCSSMEDQASRERAYFLAGAAYLGLGRPDRALALLDRAGSSTLVGPARGYAMARSNRHAEAAPLLANSRWRDAAALLSARAAADEGDFGRALKLIDSIAPGGPLASRVQRDRRCVLLLRVLRPLASNAFVAARAALGELEAGGELSEHIGLLRDFTDFVGTLRRLGEQSIEARAAELDRLSREVAPHTSPAAKAERLYAACLAQAVAWRESPSRAGEEGVGRVVQHLEEVLSLRPDHAKAAALLAALIHKRAEPKRIGALLDVGRQGGIAVPTLNHHLALFYRESGRFIDLKRLALERVEREGDVQSIAEFAAVVDREQKPELAAEDPASEMTEPSLLDAACAALRKLPAERRAHALIHRLRRRDTSKDRATVRELTRAMLQGRLQQELDEIERAEVKQWTT